MFSKWMRLAMESSMLALESQQVIAMRMMKLSLGGKSAEREAGRMVSEKIQAAGEAAIAMSLGATPGKVV